MFFIFMVAATWRGPRGPVPTSRPSWPGGPEGGLAVATLLAARERGLPQPAAVAVFSPWADISRTGASMRTKDGADPLFSHAAMGWYADKYLPNGDRSAPLASPVFGTLGGLPPMLIQVGSHEVLAGAGRIYA